MECESAPLEVGAAVSAKFRGAFCEAVVKRVLQSQVEVKVKFAKEDKGVHVVPSKVRGSPRLLHLQVLGRPSYGQHLSHIQSLRGARATVDQTCEAKHPDDGQYHKGLIVQVIDKSLYLVGMWGDARLGLAGPR
jgi:hypothetical protein